MNVTSAPPKHRSVLTAFLDTSTSGSNQVVAAPGAGVAIRVLSVAVVNGATANSVRFLSAANNKTSLFALAANGGVVLPFTEHGWFQCNNGEALNINLSGATAVGVTVTYMVL